VLWLDGLATIAEVYLDGELILASESMFRPQATLLRTSQQRRELTICLRALRPLLEVRRKPRARWRTRLVRDANLRFFRTMLIGRAPGLAAGPAVVGPYRSVLVQRLRLVTMSDLRLRAEVANGEGRVAVKCRMQTSPTGVGVEAVTLTVTGPGAQVEAGLTVEADGDGVRATGGLVIADPQLWWPHTHGSPVLYQAALRVRRRDGQEVTVDAGRVGLRELRMDRELEPEGLSLSCNGVQVFVRGAVWTPQLLGGGPASEQRLRAALEHVVDAGMNMLRVPGIACYETPRFYDLCDEFGIFVWQDFLFANLDYPERVSRFMETVDDEVHAILDELGHRPSLAVLCGGSEIAQQVAMLGLDPELANGPLYADLLPEIVREADVEAPYIPSTPWGGDLPFRPDRGVANYYGVGAYLRPVDDARRADVRFAAECLAFSNVPDDAALEGAAEDGLNDPEWKRGIPRDVGAGWDFQDVRDHYFRLLYGVDAVRMRGFDPERYLELSRHVSGEVMADVFGEWRRAASACAGGLVLWLTDLRPGPGWGLLDHRGEPKVAMHYLRRALAPVAVWGTDEGLGGMHVHVANDLPDPLRATLRVSLYRDRETPVGEAEEEIRLPGHASRSVGLEALLGHFVDVSWAYRFGPPAQDLVVLSLEQGQGAGAELLSQSFFYPVGRSLERAGASALGLEATLHEEDEEIAVLRVQTRRFAYGVRIDTPGFRPSDNAFSVEPGHRREIRLRRDGHRGEQRGRVTALNMRGSVPISEEMSS
jgi:beta-mannosidase